MYKGFPVVIINRKYSFDIYTEDFIVISTGTNTSYEKVYLINDLIINNKHNKCYCVFLDIEYDAIVGMNLVSILHI